MTLHEFDNYDVTQCSMKITRAGDGLSDSLDAAPVELSIGDEVHVVLRGTVSKVEFVEIKDSGVLKRVHTIRTQVGTLVDADAARKVLADSAKLVDAAKGIQRLPGTDDA